MSGTIRQRNHMSSAATTTRTRFDNDGSSKVPSVHLTLESMQAASPQHLGSVVKLHVPIFFDLLPRFLQSLLIKLISNCNFLSFCTNMIPQWKARYLVLLGSYIYKFSGDNNNVKGSPVPLDHLDVFLLSEEEGYQLISSLNIEFPTGYSSVFCVSNLRKKYYFACMNNEEARTWVNSIRQARQESIKRSMGHAPIDSYPKQWILFDKLGARLLGTKDRIRQKMDDSKTNEVELISLNGGSMPRAYYG